MVLDRINLIGWMDEIHRNNHNKHQLQIWEDRKGYMNKGILTVN